MKKFLLTLSLLLSGIGFASADNSADFNTFNGGSRNTSYGSYSTASGWTTENCAILEIGNDLAPTLNGRTTAVGVLTSPELQGGIGILSFDYQNTYKENNGVSVRIDIIKNDEIVKSETLTNSDVSQATRYTYTSPEFNVVGDFVIKITNLSPSNSTSNKDRVSIYNLTWTSYGAGDEPSVATPTLELAKHPVIGYAVEMYCETPNATIYYTVDTESAPDAPDKTSYEYTAPVPVSGVTYFKAIAYVGDEASYVASFTANPPYVCADFEGMTELNNGTKVEVEGTVYGVYQNGSNLYVVDTKGNGMLLYGNSSKVVNNGDAIDGLEGTYSLYLGLPEIKDYTLGAISAGSPIEPTLVTLSDINDNILNKYVKLNGLKITGSGKNFVVENASGETMNLYDNFSISVQEGENFTLVGFVGKRDTDLQLLPTEITGGIVMETVATPVFEPGSGELEANKEIVISCETEGATIYYTTDKSNPSVESTKYTEPIIFTEAMTVKAIAVKEGMLDSEIAEAVYTLYDPNGPQLRTVTFDFTDPAHFGLELPVPGSGKGTDLCDAGESFEFTEDNVTLTITANDSGTLPRIWAKNSNGSVVYDLRVYVGDIISFKADKENESIKMVEFDQNTGATTWNSENTYSPDTFDSSNKIWNGEQDAETMDEFKMVAGGGNFIAKAIVTLSTVSKVTDIEYSNDAPEVFYNLQGVRVAQPTSGLYIVVKGNKSKKVMF